MHDASSVLDSNDRLYFTIWQEKENKMVPIYIRLYIDENREIYIGIDTDEDSIDDMQVKIIDGEIRSICQ